MNNPDSCHYCNSDSEELRPYGPGGVPICLPCMKADPEREEQAKQNFHAITEAARAASGTGSVLFTPDGPNPLTSVTAAFLNGMPATEIRPGKDGHDAG